MRWLVFYKCLFPHFDIDWEKDLKPKDEEQLKELAVLDRKTRNMITGFTYLNDAACDWNLLIPCGPRKQISFQWVGVTGRQISQYKRF